MSTIPYSNSMDTFFASLWKKVSSFLPCSELSLARASARW